MADAPQVILYSTSLGKWEIWQQGRPMANASRHETLSAHFPDAPAVSQHQLEIAARHREDRLRHG